MNKLLAVAALAGLGATPAATITSATHPAAAVAAPAGNVSLLRRYDLSALLLTVSGTGGSVEAMNGFFGADRYRMEAVLTSVQRDPRQPGSYHVRGKDRFKNRVISFAGTVTLTDARQLSTKTDNLPVLYAATGTYELREDAGRQGAGTFRGHIALEFSLDDDKPELFYYYPDGPTQGGGIRYDGTWAGATGHPKPAVWVANIWSYAGPQVFQNFILGERDQHFNPKYARLGWNNYWRNDEWWTASPRPAVRLRPMLFPPPAVAAPRPARPAAAN